MSKLQFGKRIFIILAALLCALSFLGFIKGADGGNVSLASNDVDTNYSFNHIHVDIEVFRDKTIKVDERLETSFESSYVNTGIIRDIQRLSKTTRIVGGKIITGSTYLAGLSDVQAKLDGGEAKVTREYYDEGNFYSVKMQTPEGYLSSGVHVFELSYTYDMGADKVDGFDDFTFDVLGYAMNKTEKFTATVTFPEKIDENSVSFRTVGKVSWRPNKLTGESTQIKGNTIDICAYPRRAEMGYTVQVILPDGYFNIKSSFYPWYILIVILFVAAIAGIIYIVIKNVPNKPLETVEFYPPEKMSVMRFSAIWHRKERKKDLAAVILKWADSGIVEIVPDGKNDFILKPLIPAIKTTGKKKRKSVSEAAVEAEINTADYKSYFSGAAEMRYFYALFSNSGGSFHTKNAKKYTDASSLYNAAKTLVESGNNPPVVDEKPANLARKILPFLCALPFVAVLIYSAMIRLTFVPLFIAIFPLAGTFAYVSVSSTEGIDFPKIIYIFPIMFFAMPYFMYLSVFAVVDMDYLYLSYIAPFIYALGIFVLPCLRGRRKEEVQRNYGRMLGFKRFLLTAELPRIQALFDQNPEYFSDILPYCFVMGISKKVERRFAALNIKIPYVVEQRIDIGRMAGCVSRSSYAGRPASSGGWSSGGGGGGGSGGSSGGGGGGGGSRGC